MPMRVKQHRPHWLKGPKQRKKDTRGGSSKRGYDATWQKLRKLYLSEHPLCEECLTQGRTTPALDVDHVIPFKGKADSKRLDIQNLRALCRACHMRKTHGRG